jgi:hypothetical protein
MKKLSFVYVSNIMKEETRLLRSVRFIARCFFLGYLPKDLREDIPDKYILTHLSGAIMGILVPILEIIFLKPFGVDLGFFHDPNLKLSKFIFAIVALWSAYNNHLSHVIECIPEDAESSPCNIGSEDPVPLHFAIKDYLRHLRHHLKDILGEQA